MAFKTPDAALWQLWEAKRGPDGIVPDDVLITEDELRQLARMKKPRAG